MAAQLHQEFVQNGIVIVLHILHIRLDGDADHCGALRDPIQEPFPPGVVLIGYLLERFSDFFSGCFFVHKQQYRHVSRDLKCARQRRSEIVESIQLVFNFQRHCCRKAQLLSFVKPLRPHMSQVIGKRRDGVAFLQFDVVENHASRGLFLFRQRAIVGIDG